MVGSMVYILHSVQGNKGFEVESFGHLEQGCVCDTKATW